MPIPETVSSASETPPHADVVIVGGGIVGAAAALELAERGQRVVLCEKGIIGGEQSSRNWGWIRLSHRDPREMPMMLAAMDLWHGLNERVGADTGFRTCGITYGCATPRDVEAMRPWADIQREHGIPAEMVSAETALSRYPGLKVPLAGAMYNPADGRAEPTLVTSAIAKAAQRHGATILQNCAVRGVETSAGRVSAVVTETGRIACNSVLVAGGVWSRLFLGNLGINLPQLRVQNSVLRVGPVDGETPDATIKTRDFTLRRQLDGGYVVAGVLANRTEILPDAIQLARLFLPSLRNEWRELNLNFGPAFLRDARVPRRWRLDAPSPFETTRILDPEPDRKRTDKLLANLQAAYPVFRGAQVAERWGGMIDVMPDAIPVISPTEQVRNGIPGLHVASGFSGHGFGLGPAAGRLTAQMILGEPSIVDPRPFRLSRFTDGERIAPIGGVSRR